MLQVVFGIVLVIGVQLAIRTIKSTIQSRRASHIGALRNKLNGSYMGYMGEALTQLDGETNKEFKARKKAARDYDYLVPVFAGLEEYGVTKIRVGKDSDYEPVSNGDGTWTWQLCSVQPIAHSTNKGTWVGVDSVTGQDIYI